MEKPIIRVTGESVIQVIPDSMHWTINIEKRNKILKKAKMEVKNTVHIILFVLKKYKVRENDIRIMGINSRKNTEFVDKNKKIDYFLATNSMIITLYKPEIYEKIFDEIIEYTDVHTQKPITFYSKEAEAKTKAIINATIDAKEKAKSMAKVCGMSIGNAIYLSNSHRSSDYRNRYTPNYNRRDLDIDAFSMEEVSDNSSTSFSYGIIEISAEVDADFELIGDFGKERKKRRTS